MRARRAARGVAAAAALGLALGAPATRAADPPRTYVRLAEEQDGPVADLVRGLDEALAARPDQAAVVLDRLLEEASAPAAAGWVVEVAPDAGRCLGLRAQVLTRVLAAPPAVLAALRAAQDRGAAGFARTPAGQDPLAVIRRYPLSAEAAGAARRLLARAVAGGDVGLGWAMVRLLDRLHAGAPPGAGERAARALLRGLSGDAAGAEREVAALRAAPAGDPAARAEAVRLTAATTRALAALPRAPGPTAPAPSARLVEAWSVVTGEGRASDPEPPPPALAVVPFAAGGGRIAASTGTALHLLGLDGARVARLPHTREATTTPLEAPAFLARPAAAGGVVLAPVTLERGLVPGRLAADPGDAAFSGRWLSLVALDARDGRVRYWDGDAAAAPPTAGRDDGGPPPGLEAAPAPLLTALRRGHVIACAADAARVYVALLPKAKEPEVLVFAYARDAGGGGLALTPAWPAPASLFASERSNAVNAEDEPVAPEVAAALALDGAGRLVVTTDAGVAAALDVATGQVEWLVRPPPRTDVGPGAPGLRRRLRPPPAPPAAPPEPARFVEGADGPCAGVLLGDEVVALDLDDGARRGAAPRGGVTRTAVVDGHLLAYDADQVVLLEPRTLKLRLRGPLAPGVPVLGELAVAGRTLVVATREVSGVVALRRLEAALEAPIPSLRAAGEVVVVPNVRLPALVNLAATPDGVVVASGRRVSLYAWRER